MFERNKIMIKHTIKECLGLITMLFRILTNTIENLEI